MLNRILGTCPKILVVKPADLGDLLFVTPALRALRETYPDAQIDLMTPPSSATLLRDCPYLDTVITFDKYVFDEASSFLSPANWRALFAFGWRLRRERYDVVLIPRHLTTWMGTFKYAGLALVTGAPHRVGLHNGRGWFLTEGVCDRGFGARHEVEYDLAVARRVGARTTETGLWVPQNPAAEQWARAFIKGLPSPRIIVHPGSGDYSTARRWPAASFAEFADCWLSRYGGTVILIDATPEVTRRVQAAARHDLVDLGGKTSLLQTIALLRRATLFIGNDSGPLHLAAGAGVPALGIYGLTNQRAWGPWGEHTRIVSRSDLPCMPCLYRGYRLGLRNGCPDRPCLTELSVDAVLAAAEEVYKESQRYVHRTE